MKQWLLSTLVASSLVASGVTLPYLPHTVLVVGKYVLAGVIFVVLVGLLRVMMFPPQIAKARNGSCNFVAPITGYAPCDRHKGHSGPCAHEMSDAWESEIEALLDKHFGTRDE